MNKALVIIDLQNDYFPGGKYPLWNTAETLEHIKHAAESAREQDIPVIIVQHVANPEKGMSPFFNKGTEGVDIHPVIFAAAPDAPVIIKEHADSFFNTSLGEVLDQNNVEELIVCGMMTQNCVTHTAISKSAEKFKVSVLGDCCTSIDRMIHAIALNALTTRIAVVDSSNVTWQK